MLILIEVESLFEAFAFLGAIIGFIFVLLVGLYIYSAIVLMTIAKKTRTKDPWLAWIPIANLYLMTKIAKVPWWTIIVLIAGGVIPFVGAAIIIGITTWWWWKICEARKKPEWYSLLMLIPIVNLVIMGIIAWKD